MITEGMTVATIRSRQGEQCFCPSCGAPGRYEDTLRRYGKTGQYGDWIRFNTTEENFECHECHLK